MKTIPSPAQHSQIIVAAQPTGKTPQTLMMFFHKNNLFDFTFVCYLSLVSILFAVEMSSLFFLVLIIFHNFVLILHLSVIRHLREWYLRYYSLYFKITLFPFTSKETLRIFSIRSNISETSLYFTISIEKRNSLSSELA